MRNLGKAVGKLGLCISLFLLLGLSGLLGQDRIFTLDGRSIPCKINTIDKKIDYQIFTNLSGPKYLIKAKEVAFIVYENGDIQAFKKKKRKYIPFQLENYDLILLSAKSFFPVDEMQISSNGLSGISLSEEAHPRLQFNRKEVLGVWDRNKEFKAMDAHELIRDALFATPLPVQIFPRKMLPRDDSFSEIESVFRANVSFDTSSVPEPVFEQPKVFEIDEDEFKRKAVAKVSRLTQYISLISDKETPINNADRAINEALILFVSDTCIVQVSSIKKPQSKPREEYIRRYLQNLKSLLYDKVEIEWADINYVSDLKKDPGGNYWGMVSFLQRFKGFRDGKVAYSDRVTKNVKVWFKSYEKFNAGVAESLWDVMLSDIMVEQTELY